MPTCAPTTRTLAAALIGILGPFGLGLGATLMAQQSDQPEISADIPLTEDNFADWRTHILPAQDELGWQQIPWLTTFKDGILSADAAGKPLLLWTMNGHPLGCT